MTRRKGPAAKVGGAIADWAWIILPISGLTVTVLRPENVTKAVRLNEFAARHGSWFLAIWMGLLVVGLGIGASAWGPIRISRARTSWVLSGPGRRTPSLVRSLIATTVVVAMLNCLGAFIISRLAPSSLPLLVGIAVGGGVLTCAIGYLVQTTRPIAAHGRRHLRSWHPESLHRNVFSPRDALAASISLAVTMMDLDWLSRARLTRWELRHAAGRTRRLPNDPRLALIVTDLVRLWRHRNTMVAVGGHLVVAVLAATTLTIGSAREIVVVLMAYLAGTTTAIGLRMATEQPLLIRSLGLSRRTAVTALAALPILTVCAWFAALGPLWNLTVLQGVVMAVGVSIAVVSRATRGPLPYDSEVNINPVEGTAVQVPLVTALLTGPAIAAAAGGLAMIVAP